MFLVETEFLRHCVKRICMIVPVTVAAPLNPKTTVTAAKPICLMMKN